MEKKYARIKLDTLQKAKDAGSLAIPNAWLYFVASQLKHFTSWARSENLVAIRRLLMDWSGWCNLGWWLETGGTVIQGSQYTLALVYKVWDRGKIALGLSGLSKFSPIF